MTSTPHIDLGEPATMSTYDSPQPADPDVVRNDSPSPGVRQSRGSTPWKVGAGVAVVAAAALIFAVVTGAVGRREATPPASPGPSAACSEALDRAEQVIGLEGQAVRDAAAALSTISDLDAAAMNEQAANIRALTPQVQAARTQYDQAAAQCRNGS